MAIKAEFSQDQSWILRCTGCGFSTTPSFTLESAGRKMDLHMAARFPIGTERRACGAGTSPTSDPPLLAKDSAIADSAEGVLANVPPGGPGILLKNEIDRLTAPGPEALSLPSSAQRTRWSTPVRGKNPKRVELGKRRAKTITSQDRQKGGRLGGAARANALAPDVRSTIARNAALSRWGKR